jgi:putative SOS response-associated peptidase YedK
MCGRFTNRLTWEEIARLYRLTIKAPPHNLPPRYNICPTDPVDVVTKTGAHMSTTKGSLFVGLLVIGLLMSANMASSETSNLTRRGETLPVTHMLPACKDFDKFEKLRQLYREDDDKEGVAGYRGNPRFPPPTASAAP